MSCFFLSVMLHTSCFAGTVHALLCIELGDYWIAKSVERDHQRMKQFVELVSRDRKKPLQLKELIGGNLTRYAIVQWLHELHSSPQDIIIVYYAGHGVREKTNYTPWPYFNLLRARELFPSATIIEHLAAKPHQLTLCVFDCCNCYLNNFPYDKEKPVKKPYLKINDLKKKNVKRQNKPKSAFAGNLFRQKGTIIIAAARAMEWAYEDGFTPVFTHALQTEPLLSNWEVALNLVTNRCKSFQNPFYFITKD